MKTSRELLLAGLVCAALTLAPTAAFAQHGGGGGGHAGGGLLTAWRLHAEEPVDAAHRDVAREFADGAEALRGLPGELIGGERLNGVAEADLIAVPTVEHVG